MGYGGDDESGERRAQMAEEQDVLLIEEPVACRQ